MARKRKRKRSSVVEIRTGPCRVEIHTVNRKDGYPMYSLYWKEGRQRRFRKLACQEESRLIVHQITVRLANGFDTGNEATKRSRKASLKQASADSPSPAVARHPRRIRL